MEDLSIAPNMVFEITRMYKCDVQQIKVGLHNGRTQVVSLLELAPAVLSSLSGV